MRKLTGYIGAMIIVIALMGSILAGYALNINGTNTVMNEYEKVTDVSGLYTHSQEPTYIDYNPASNYIGYSLENTRFESDPGFAKMKSHSTSINITVDCATGNISYNGTTKSPIDDDMALIMWEKETIMYFTGGISSRGQYNDTTYSGTFEIKYNGDTDTVNIYKNGTLVSVSSNIAKIICYCGNDADFDYYQIHGRYLGYTNNVNAYVKDISDIYSYDLATPRIGDTANIAAPLMLTGNYFLGEDRVNHSVQTGHLTSPGIFTDLTQIGNNLYTVNANFNDYTTNELGTPVTDRTITGYYIAYPAFVDYGGTIGINYVESTRVNNYPMETEYDTEITTSTGSFNLQTFSAADYRGDFLSEYLVYTGNYDNHQWVLKFKLPTYTNNTGTTTTDAIHCYKLSDILATISPPPGTTQIRFECPTNTTWYTQSVTFPWMDPDNPGSTRTFQYFIPDNWVYFSDPGNYNTDMWQPPYTSNPALNNYIIYNVNTGIAEIYNWVGVKLSAVPPDMAYIYFVDNDSYYGQYQLIDLTANQTYNNVYDATNTRGISTLNIIYTTQGQISTVHYSDITKGYSIKSGNVTNTIWNNEYNNGDIKLLFRAESTLETYHNDIIIGNNAVSVDYSLNRYLITLNGGEPVDIGTWRNIVLDIDLVNGKLSAIPVRTFNSFTNVVTDNTNIFIGDLLNTTSTNIIKWTPTPNSLMFNIYSTSVFMDTYGVVMVDPTLNITDYFTDLNNFYQLRLSNFSMYGQSMTVNGVTGTVTEDKITFNGETVQLKEMAITYADGNVTISDSYGKIDLGAIVDNTISMTGAWYFISELYSGYTTQKVIYDWDWGQFILDDKAFGVIYIGLCLIGLIVARHFCTLTVTDYIIFVVSIVFALTVPVIA